MNAEVLRGIFIPFAGTILGSACVFFMRGKMNSTLQRALSGFAGGVMTAASVWSLIIPAINYSEHMGAFSFVPAAVGFWVGILFLLFLNHAVPHLHVNSSSAEGPKSSLKKTSMLVLAVALHNLPEGMAVGVVFAGRMSPNPIITSAAALALALGIAIQNFPEGAIISMPLAAEGSSRKKAFFYGIISGVIEPIGAILTIMASELVLPILPYLLSFAAGAMIFVVVEELIPEMSGGKPSEIGTLMFSAGFTLMMILDVALG